MNYLERIANAKALTHNVEIIYQDEEELQAVVTSQNTTEQYLISCVDELWYCTCEDFHIHGLNNDTKLYVCKHMLATFFHLKEDNRKWQLKKAIKGP